MRLFLYFSILLSLINFAPVSADTKDNRSHTILVSVAPYKFFVEALVDGTAKVNLLVPPGASFHDYEPTPRQVLQASQADIWFRIGETFENRALQALKSHNNKMLIVDLREKVDLILADGHHHTCCNHSGADLHMWLSPKQAKIQAGVIAEALSKTYPEHAQAYKKNLQKLSNSLDQLDQEIKEQLSLLKNRTIMVGHPAYAYFARDYDLIQMPIEYEGKDPSPRQLNDVLNKARKEKIRTIFVQPQHSKKGAELIGKEIGAKVVVLDPYSGDYFDNLRKIAISISDQE
jgi:zinc transport system substrate-binding protein